LKAQSERKRRASRKSASASDATRRRSVAGTGRSPAHNGSAQPVRARLASAQAHEARCQPDPAPAFGNLADEYRPEGQQEIVGGYLPRAKSARAACQSHNAAVADEPTAEPSVASPGNALSQLDAVAIMA
jgi:hypothetical protein